MSVGQPVKYVDFHPGCPREECICHQPWGVCEQSLAWPGEPKPWDVFCPRCGWHADRHPPVGSRPLRLAMDGHAYHRRIRARRGKR